MKEELQFINAETFDPSTALAQHGPWVTEFG